MKMLRRLSQRRAFTLIELLVVILIVAILIAVALPSFLGQTAKAQISVVEQRLTVATSEAKALWTGTYQQAGFPTAASASQTVAGQLSASEPGYKFVADTGSSATAQAIGVNVNSANIITFCQATPTGTFLCVRSDETAADLYNIAGANNTAAPASDSLMPASADAALGYTEMVRASGPSEAAALCILNAATPSAGGTGVIPSGCSSQGGEPGWSAISGSGGAAAAGVSVPSVLISPAITGSAYVGAQLTASTGSWSQNPTSYTYQWQVCTDAAALNCTPVSGAAGDQATFTVTSADTNGYISVDVTASNGSYSSAAAPSTNVAGPVTGGPAGGSVTVTGADAVGKTLTGSASGWAFSPTAYSYQWYDCPTQSSPLASCTATASGASATGTGITDALSSSDAGTYVVLSVTASNAAGTTVTDTSSPTSEIVNVPVNTVAPSISGTPAVGNTLTVSGTWTYSPTSYSYQWYDCPSSATPITSCTAISGATSASYTVAQNDTFAYINVAMSATNAAGTSPSSTASAESSYATSSTMMAGNCAEFGGAYSDGVSYCDMPQGFALFNGNYEAELTPGGVLEVVNTTDQSVVWSDGSVGSSSFVRLQGDNNMIVSGSSGSWSINVYSDQGGCPNGGQIGAATCSPADYLKLSSSGVLSDYNSSGTVVWSS